MPCWLALLALIFDHLQNSQGRSNWLDPNPNRLSKHYEIYSTAQAFLALDKTRGTGQCWGGAGYGADCISVDFRGVTKVYSTERAFLALDEATGTGQCWGSTPASDCTSIDFRGVTKVYSTNFAFLAINTATETAQCWGMTSSGAALLSWSGGDCTSVDFRGVTKVYTTYETFLAINEVTGRGQCWGGHNMDPSVCASVDFRGVTKVYSNYNAFVAINEAMGTGQCFGDASSGGDCTSIDFRGVKNVYSTDGAFLTLDEATGTVQCWGKADMCALRCSGVCDDFRSVTKVYSNNVAFLIIDEASGIGTCSNCNNFGFWNTDGSYEYVPIDFRNVTKVSSTGDAFLALNEAEGVCQCWGSWSPADCTSVDCTGVTQVYSNFFSFLAIDEARGTGQCWGFSDAGGNCSSINFSFALPVTKPMCLGQPAPMNGKVTGACRGLGSLSASCPWQCPGWSAKRGSVTCTDGTWSRSCCVFSNIVFSSRREVRGCESVHDDCRHVLLAGLILSGDLPSLHPGQANCVGMCPSVQTLPEQFDIIFELNKWDMWLCAVSVAIAIFVAVAKLMQMHRIWTPPRKLAKVTSYVMLLVALADVLLQVGAIVVAVFLRPLVARLRALSCIDVVAGFSHVSMLQSLEEQLTTILVIGVVELLLGAAGAFGDVHLVLLLKPRSLPFVSKVVIADYSWAQHEHQPLRVQIRTICEHDPSRDVQSVWQQSLVIRTSNGEQWPWAQVDAVSTPQQFPVAVDLRRGGTAIQAAAAVWEGFEFGVWAQMKATFLLVLTTSVLDFIASALDFVIFTMDAKRQTDFFVHSLLTAARAGNYTVWCMSVSQGKDIWPGTQGC